jgi:hypothetical protein
MSLSLPRARLRVPLKSPVQRGGGGRRELPAGGGNVPAPGVPDGAAHPSGAHLVEELLLRRQRAGVPRAAWGGIERDEVNVPQGAEPLAQQPAQQLRPPRLVVDVPDQRILDRHPPPRDARVVAGRFEHRGYVPAAVDRNERVAQLIIRGVE